MNLSSLQTLTWSTVAAAVASALALAAIEPPGGLSSTVVIGARGQDALPAEPTAAGPAASAAGTGSAAQQPGTAGL